MEDQINEQEALSVIRGSIAETKESLKEKGWIYVILGSIFFLGALINFITLKVDLNGSTDIMLFTISIAGMVSIIYGWVLKGSLHKKFEKGKRIPDGPLTSMWAGFGMVLILITIGEHQLSNATCTFLIAVILMVATISDGILGFNAFKAGVGISCIIAMVSHWFKIDNQLLLVALAALVSFVIPGILLLRTKNSTNSSTTTSINV